MKKWLYAFLIVVVAFCGLTFWYKNHQIIEISYYFGIQFEIELSLLLVLTFSVGLFTGYVVMLLNALNVKRKLLQANQQLRAWQKRHPD